MADYVAPLADMRFALTATADLPALLGLPAFKHAEADVIDAVLDEAARFSGEVIAPLNRVGDQTGSRIENGEVRTPPGFADAYRQFCAGGWNGVPFATDHGGGGLPWTIAMTVQEMMGSANMAFSLCPLLTQGAVEAIAAHGTAEQKKVYLPKLVSGEWTGTMNLTEPRAGSEVGALRTRADPDGAGAWRIKGTKIFITYGDHDMTANVIHLVLARTPGAPAGTKGISLFLVPKFLPKADGTPGPRNDVRCLSLEHKLGIHASPTCVLSFGDNEGALGYLVGEENAGMRCMFTMMNNARLSVGLQGLSIAERAYQQALAFARERRQGQRIDGKSGDRSAPIIEHADVRRMLMLMKSQIEAMRALICHTAAAMDLSHHHADAATRALKRAEVDLLIPVCKAWSTDLGCELTSLNVQIHGGMGYVEETGAAQHLRDARIAPIYEGTNGIQALDLVGRKLSMNGGAAVKALLGTMRALGQDIAKDKRLEPMREPFAQAVEALSKGSEWMTAAMAQDPHRASGGASALLRLFGTVVGGWLLIRQAQAAASLIDAGTGGEFHQAKIATARFYAAQILPQAGGLLTAATSGADELAAMPAGAFA
jgi:3-(methylthio)propanoyl-CoA dehydrogenase